MNNKLKNNKVHFIKRFRRTSLAAILFSVGSVHSASAFTLAFFPGGTYSTDSAAMDSALGVSGYVTEDFEDTNLISGLSIDYTGNGFAATRTTLTNVLTFSGGWDGTAIVTNDPANASPANGAWPMLTTFNYAPGTQSFGIGLGGFQSLSLPVAPVTDHRLYINGVVVPGTLENLAGANWTATSSGRSTYLRIDAEAGETITSVGFENILNLDPNGISSDVLLFDHLTVETVPELSSTFLLLGSMGLVALRRRRARDSVAEQGAATNRLPQAAR